VFCLEKSTNWTIGLVLEVAKIATLGQIPIINSLDSRPVNLVSVGIQKGLNGSYEIFRIKTEADFEPTALLTTANYHLYVAKLPSGQLGFMKISANVDCNSAIDHEYQTLQYLHQKALENDNLAIKAGQKNPFYEAFFPNPLEIIDIPDGRKAIFIGFDPSIQEYKQLSPLSVILRNRRVDLQTTMWILGKLIKLLVFVHEEGYANLFVDPSNVLIEPNLHAVFVLDWSYSRGDQKFCSSDIHTDLQAAAKLAWLISGGTNDSPPPHDSDILSQKGHDEFVEFIHDLNLAYNARSCWSLLYQEPHGLAHRLWPKEELPNGKNKRVFHPFRTYDLPK